MSYGQPINLSPANEESRLRELYRYEILRTPTDPVFDDLARLAAQVCNAPMAVISFMDRDHQWFKSRHGVECWEFPRDNTFCAQVIREKDLLVVPDPTDDERFVTSPAVIGNTQARFYAGVPLLVPSGHALGALSVLDRRPRTLDDGQRESLCALARQVVAQLELRRSIADLRRAADERARVQADLRKSELRFQDFMEHSPALAFIKDENGRYIYVNRRLAEDFGRPASEWLGKIDTEIFPDSFAQNLIEHDLSVFNEGKTQIVEEIAPVANGDVRHFISYKFLLRDGHGPRQMGGIAFDITERKGAELERERLVAELQEALAQVKALKEFLPICAMCKNVRDDEGYWQQIESYFHQHSNVEFSHGICPVCLAEAYPEFAAHKAAHDGPAKGG